MSRKNWLAWTAVLALVLVIALPASAMAMTVRRGSQVTVPSGETISDDLYAFGNTVTIDGTVDGDVVAFAQVVVINGDVKGSVVTAAQTVRIGGTVDGSVRAAGQLVDVNGTVNGDVLAGANTVGVTGRVDRDLAAGAQDVAISGIVGRNLMTGSESLAIDGDVNGNVQAQSTNVVVGKDGTVGGNLEYWSATPAVVRGDVSGATTRHDPPSNQGNNTSTPGGIASAILAAVVAWVQSFVGVLILGLLLVLIPRGPMRGGSQAALNRPWLSLGIGALVFFATPMVALFIFVIGLFIGAWWLAFVLLAALWLLLLLGVIAGSLALGRLLLRHAHNGGEPSLVWSLLLGLVLVWVVSAIPVVGWAVGWAAMTIGSGALLLLRMGKSERAVRAVPQPAMPMAAPAEQPAMPPQTPPTPVTQPPAQPGTPPTQQQVVVPTQPPAAPGAPPEPYVPPTQPPSV